MGLTTARGSWSLVVHSHTVTFASQIKEIISTLLSLGAFPVDFRLTSVQYLEDPEVRPHRDAGNIGTSVTVGLGGYSGGALNLDGTAHDVRHAPIHYDGKLLHFVEPFTGNRVSLTFFTHARFAEASLEQRNYLSDLGFRLPAASRNPPNPEVVAPPPRVAPKLHGACSDLFFPDQGIILIELGQSCGAAAAALCQMKQQFSFFFCDEDEAYAEMLSTHFPACQRVGATYTFIKAVSAHGDLANCKVIVSLSAKGDVLALAKLWRPFLPKLDEVMGHTTSAMIVSDAMDEHSRDMCAELLSPLRSRSTGRISAR